MFSGNFDVGYLNMNQGREAYTKAGITSQVSANCDKSFLAKKY